MRFKPEVDDRAFHGIIDSFTRAVSSAGRAADFLIRWSMVQIHHGPPIKSSTYVRSPAPKKPLARLLRDSVMHAVLNKVSVGLF